MRTDKSTDAIRSSIVKPLPIQSAKMHATQTQGLSKRLQRDKGTTKAKIDDKLYFRDNGVSASKLSISKSRGSKRLAPPNLHIRAGSKDPRRIRR